MDYVMGISIPNIEPAEYPGGTKMWKAYISENINLELGNECIDIPKGESSAMQTIETQFTIDTSGYVENVCIMNHKVVHPLLAKETSRIIKNSPRWKPSRRNGLLIPYIVTEKIIWTAMSE
jgi:hypothetical protein